MATTEKSKSLKVGAGFLLFVAVMYVLFLPSMPVWVTTVAWVIFVAAILVLVEISFSPFRALYNKLFNKTPHKDEEKKINEV
jgi:fatty acid desaturase